LKRYLMGHFLGQLVIPAQGSFSPSALHKAGMAPNSRAISSFPARGVHAHPATLTNIACALTLATGKKSLRPPSAAALPQIPAKPALFMTRDLFEEPLPSYLRASLMELFTNSIDMKHRTAYIRDYREHLSLTL
jgi:hypothetical protein